METKDSQPYHPDKNYDVTFGFFQSYRKTIRHPLNTFILESEFLFKFDDVEWGFFITNPLLDQERYVIGGCHFLLHWWSSFFLHPTLNLSVGGGYNELLKNYGKSLWTIEIKAGLGFHIQISEVFYINLKILFATSLYFHNVDFKFGIGFFL